MRRSLFSYAGGVLALCVIGWSSATTDAQSPQVQSPQATSDTTAPATLTIGVSHSPPFAMETKTDSGSDWDGIGVHLWREIAEDLDIPYEWQKISPAEAVQQVQNGTVDIAITASATADAVERPTLPLVLRPASRQSLRKIKREN